MINKYKKTTKLLLLAMLTLSLTNGCVWRRVLILDDGKEVSRVKKGEAITAKQDGYFVPDARMREILNAISEKVVFGGTAVTNK